MKKNKNAIAIALLLILSITAIHAINAQPNGDTYRLQTFSIIEVANNPIGVGQELMIIFGITEFREVYYLGFEGLTVTVTKPDGQIDTLGPVNTDSTGLTGLVYIPTMEGTYKLQSHFPEQIIVWTVPQRYHPPELVGEQIVFEASDSDIIELVVQSDPIPQYPGHQLPTEYWTRPIDAQLREWSVISGNWVGGAYRDGGFIASYNAEPPETAHVLWSKPLQMGGLAGGEFGVDPLPAAFEDGDAYEGFWDSSIIIGGVHYYNQFKANHPTRTVVAVDIHTGEEQWRGPLIDSTGKAHRLAFGQTLFFSSFNYHGVFPYLWAVDGTTWHAFDPNDGSWVYSLTNVPGGFNRDTPIRGPSGEILIYTLDFNQGRMTVWNSTLATVPQDTGTSRDGSWIRGDMGTIIDARQGIQLNVTIPTNLRGTVEGAFVEEILFGGHIEFNPATVRFWAISLEPGREGQLLFDKTWQPPVADVTPYFSRTTRVNSPGVCLETGVFAIYVCELRQFWGFSLATGEQIWGPTEPQRPLDFIRSSNVRYQIYSGKLISAMTGGTVYAYDALTGDLLWTYDVEDKYTEMLWGPRWPIKVAFYVDDKMYLGFSEHSPIDPKPRGAPFICLNVNTGEEIWRADGLFRQVDWGGYAIIGDNIIVTMDSYSQLIFAIGKGPSATMVSVGPKVSVHGSSVIVEGAVTDISPGTKSAALQMRFPNGVPAVADESMNEWMLYVYKQFERPADVVGVEVIVSVLDPNNNYYEVGRTTSDSTGFFKLAFEPEVPGEYTIIAEFEGSKAYYGSFAQTAVYVEETPTVPPESTPVPQAPVGSYFAVSTIAIIVAIAIVGAIVLLALRKR